MPDLFLCGDVMTGRGVDQILASPGDPALREPSISDARCYVRLAEQANGTIGAPVADTWPWGDALGVLDRLAPDARIINLETAVTSGGEFSAAKDIHYRMNPANVGCLTCAQPDVCSLANNHALDFGTAGLIDTLDTLAGADLVTVGAGFDEASAWRPAVVGLADGGQLVVLAAGLSSSGVPPDWAAGHARPGVAFLTAGSRAARADLARRVRAAREEHGGILVVSLHSGPNWGYDVTTDEAALAHEVIEAGADLVHGHSSHHARPAEVYRHRLILYGCGDFIDDYEGIGGHQRYRADLRPMWFASLWPDGRLGGLRIAVMRARQMRLWPASRSDAAWLAGELTRVGRRFGTALDISADGTLQLRWRDLAQVAERARDVRVAEREPGGGQPAWHDPGAHQQLVGDLAERRPERELRRGE